MTRIRSAAFAAVISIALLAQGGLALGRSVGVLANSSNTLNATKAAASGLELYKRETKALIVGQSGLVTYASSVNASPTAAYDLKCFVDPATGQLVGLEQAGAVSCSTAASVVVVPTSTAGYISQVKLAYTYDGAFVGRLIFEVKAIAAAKPLTFTCGSAGGKAVSLLPNDNGYAITKLNVGCASLPAIDAGRRRLKAAPGLGLSAGKFAVTAAPLSVLPVDPITGLLLTSSIGNVLVPPSPIVTPGSASLPAASTTLVINGFNFDPSPAGNVVALSSGTVRSISSASATSLTIVFATQPRPGRLLASVTAFGLSSGAAVQVATVANVAVTAALVANDNGQTVTQCAIIGGSITSCAVPTGVTWNLNASYGMTVANNVAYITSRGANTVTQCALSGGSITSCAVPTGVTWNLNQPAGIAIANNVAYITNGNGNTVTECAISGGSIISCVVPSVASWNLRRPYGIAVANNVAYITNNLPNTVTQCTISGGSITSCAVPTGVTWNLNNPYGIAVVNNVAYIVNYFGGSVTQCTIIGGSITSCAVPTGFTWNLSAPYGNAVANNVAYVTNIDGSTVAQCAISGGSITSCAVPTGVTWNLNRPLAIAVV